MSSESEVIARVLALYWKASELTDKGYTLRAAEYYERSAEAARTLDPGDDNFVTLNMRLNQATSLFSFATLTCDDKPAARAYVAESIALFMVCSRALERRRMADTLLEGCTAAEGAWLAALLQHRQCHPAMATSLRKQFGYDAFMSTASSVLGVVVNATAIGVSLSAAQKDVFAHLVVHGMDLLQAHRCRFPTEAEVDFVESLSDFFPRLGSRGLDPQLAQLLTDAWHRLQQSGVLEQRGLLDERGRLKSSADSKKLDEAAQAALRAPGRRSCALASCGAKEAHPQHYKSCARILPWRRVLLPRASSVRLAGAQGCLQSRAQGSRPGQWRRRPRR